MKLSIIIVSHNSSSFIGSCLTSLIHSRLKSTDFFVVDNNSSDDSLALIKHLYPFVKIIENKKNFGFATACNQAIQQTKSDYVLLLNPDVYVQKNTLQLLLNYMDKHPSVGISACKLLYENGNLQYSCRTFGSVLSRILATFSPKSAKVASYLMKDYDHKEPKKVDWLIGAFLLINKKVFRDVTLLDERFFLYFEDVDLCKRVAAAGWDVVYYPKAVATHTYKQASKRFFSKEQFYHLKSMFQYYMKHGWKFI